MGLKCWSDPTIKDAYRLAVACLVITFLTAFGGIAIWMRQDLSLALAFGLENCVDFLSDAIVLWRFFAPHQLDEDVKAKLEGREVRASVAISFILVFLGLQVIIAALNDFAQGRQEETEKEAALVLSFFSILVFGAIALIKIRYSKALDSESLYKDAICSLIGAILAAALFLNTLIIDSSPEAWWMDPFIAFIAGILAFFYGVYTLHVARSQEHHAIFSLSWWRSSGEVADRPPTKSANTEMVDTEVV
ncbi:hypothetical protein FisN_1Lh494 [Fistulifera solaris]|uniref:Cation efflux protein transmembrane domain-containing protein n=1 Tax=Fistulifera solaris TaxID=1519565 RepID=A0A1Z5K159_FISSO|nr:hypothetical protein FisN_1Lh494 [Fistulifera solaris]|eukprot:GAX20025.1 hypothetical protein FisN_1Lh494 [Fistulifera solaris]